MSSALSAQMGYGSVCGECASWPSFRPLHFKCVLPPHSTDQRLLDGLFGAICHVAQKTANTNAAGEEGILVTEACTIFFSETGSRSGEKGFKKGGQVCGDNRKCLNPTDNVVGFSTATVV